MKRVILKSTYEYTDDEVEDMDEGELIARAKEAFYLDGAEVSAEVEEVDHE